MSLFSKLEHTNEISHGDRERTEKRFRAAVSELKAALALRPKHWATSDELELNDVLENEDTSSLQELIELRLNRKHENQSTWGKGRILFQQVFSALFPIARNVLLIAKEAQAVCHMLSCA